MNRKKIAIIGAGASGLLCAIYCARNSIDVDIYEQNTKCAKKILVSGNGRCNIINTNVTKQNYFTQYPDFLQDSLEGFSYKEFENFAHSIGLMLDIKTNGKVYPLSNEAKSVASLLINTAKSLGVKFHTDTKITEIKELFKNYKKLVVATGSLAASHLGGNNDGLEFARLFGHNIIPGYPSLVQLELNSSLHQIMSGSKVDGEVTLLINNRASSKISGDILFTNYGVSGFAILDISQEASEALLNYQIVDISLNLLPRYSAQKLSTHIMKMNEINPNASLLDVLHGLLPLKIIKALLEKLELSPNLEVKQINTKLSKKIANQILNWKFEVKDTHGFRHAEVAGGGVDVSEINPKTMESLKKKDLYFCGEVLDVVGQRGGYNFAWAWASAYACAKDIIKMS